MQKAQIKVGSDNRWTSNGLKTILSQQISYLYRNLHKSSLGNLDFLPKPAGGAHWWFYLPNQGDQGNASQNLEPTRQSLQQSKTYA